MLRSSAMTLIIFLISGFSAWADCEPAPNLCGVRGTNKYSCTNKNSCGPSDEKFEANHPNCHSARINCPNPISVIKALPTHPQANYTHCQPNDELGGYVRADSSPVLVPPKSNSDVIVSVPANAIVFAVHCFGKPGGWNHFRACVVGRECTFGWAEFGDFQDKLDASKNLRYFYVNMSNRHQSDTRTAMLSVFYKLPE